MTNLLAGDPQVAVVDVDEGVLEGSDISGIHQARGPNAVARKSRGPKNGEKLTFLTLLLRDLKRVVGLIFQNFPEFSHF